MTAVGKVLCLTSNFPRWEGDSTTPFVLHLAQDLGRLGWEVDVLAPHAPGAARRERLAGIDVHRFRYLWPVAQETVCYQGGALVNLRRVPANRLKLPALVAAEWAALRRLVRTRHYDVVHAHWMLPQGFVATTVPNRPPVVITVHGGDIFALQGRVMRHCKAMALRRCAAVTVNSSFTEAAVRGVVPDLHSVRRIPMGVTGVIPDMAETDAVRSTYRVGDGPLLVFVGRLVDEKGVADLLETAALLAVHQPDVRAVIVGEGQDRAAFEDQARRLGLHRRVHFIGWVQPETVGSYLAAADVVVAPSRRSPEGWVEAQGLTIVEAMMAGAPVVATRLGGVVDAVVPGETGLLVDERSPAQLAAAINRLTSDADLAERCRRGGRRLALDRFSRSATATAFAELFTELAASSRSDSAEARAGR